MADITHDNQSGFHWTPLNLSFSFLLGTAATLGIWFLAGTLIMLFLL